MQTKLIELENGILVEIEAKENEVQQISGGMVEKVGGSIDRLKPIILKACEPVLAAWRELNKEMHIAEAEIELGLGFEGEGNIYITKAKASANYTIKLKLKAPDNQL